MKTKKTTRKPRQVTALVQITFNSNVNKDTLRTSAYWSNRLARSFGSDVSVAVDRELVNISRETSS